MTQDGSRVIGRWEGGVPFRLGPSDPYPTFTQADLQRSPPVLVRDAHARVFDMGQEPDIAEYEQIWDRAAKGLVVISAEDRQFCEPTQNWKIFLRWGELSYELPKGRTIHNGQTCVYTSP